MRFQYTATQLKKHLQAGFTIPEMLATVAIIIIVIAMLLPALGKSRESAWSAECSNNLHQTSLAMNAFKAETRKMANPSQIIYGLDAFYGSVEQNSARRCPMDIDFDGTSYGANPCATKLIGEPGKIVALDSYDPFVFYENTSSEYWLETVAPRHWGSKMNILHQGGHVELHEPDDTINPYFSTEVLESKWKPKLPCDMKNEELGCGCTGTYYTGGAWNGDSASRIDTTLHMPFGGAFFSFNYWDIPLPGTNAGGWDTGSFGSGTWTGTIKATHTEDYTFHIACDNEAWLYVNGSLVIHRSAGGVAGVTSYEASASPVSLIAGQAVDIEVRLKEHSPGRSPSHVSVKWESKSTPMDIIPCSALRP